MDTNEGAGEAMLKTKPTTRSRSSNSSGWRKMLMCCLKQDEDDVQVLDYEHSSLTDVPAEIFNHERTLEILRLDCNQISDLPRPLFHCHGLKELWLSDNEISQLPPALASLIHLQVLDVSKNALAEVPDSISGLKALITLDLSVNPLGKLPEAATKLFSLESLNLSDTFLEFLPANFGRLTKLRLLELRENQLATLPKSMARLTALKRLDLGQNELSDVPEVVGSIPSLTELWVDGNKLDVIPEFIGHLPNLVHLDASRNCLHGIAPTIGLCKSLSDLSLTSNNLSFLPEEIGDLTQLTVLRVDDNRLTSLPDSIGRLSNLEELQAGQNRLSKLPSSIGLLRKLETLMLNENLLEDLPAELGSCQKLTVVSLRKNKLESIPPEMGHLSRLRVINLSCNRLLHLPVSFLKLPSLTALWLSEAQTKPVVPLQTDTDSSTGHKVLTCFLLPQSSHLESVEQETIASDQKDNAVTARSPTHIKFAFDGETDHRAGKLMRNPTPYPKELKALAKHAQHIQQHQHNPHSSLRSSAVEMTQSSKSLANEGHMNNPSNDGAIKRDDKAVTVSPTPARSSTSALVCGDEHMEVSVTVVSSLSREASPVSDDFHHRQLEVMPLEECGPTPVSCPATQSESPVEQVPPLLPPVSTASSPLAPKRHESEAARPNGVPAELSPRSAEIEIKEARVLRPIMSTTSSSDGANKEDKAKNPITTTTAASTTTDAVDRSSQLDLSAETVKQQQQQQPPPYHVAAAYSKRAAEFNHAASLPRTQSTDSGFTVDGTSVAEKRDSSPSRDSGRGPSIEPLEDHHNGNHQSGNSAMPALAVVQPVIAAAKRPIDLPLNTNLLDQEKATPLALKRATYIIERSLSPTTNGTEVPEESADPQSVAALRQAAREVFNLSASPRASPLPVHKQPSVWDVPPTVHSTSASSNGSSALSAAHVVGLPTSTGNPSENGVQQPTKIQGRLPPPRYHVSNGNGFRDAVPAELKSPPPATASSRIPLASHNRLPSGLPRQLSNLSNHSVMDGPTKVATPTTINGTNGVNNANNAPTLPPKQRDSPPPPTLLPKLSTSRIPPPQVHTPATPLTPVSSKTTFSPLPVHSARLVTPTTPATPIIASNNNEADAHQQPPQQSNRSISSSQLNTRIPLPKFSVSDVTKTGPSPGSKIPTRLPTPTSATTLSKSKLTPDMTSSPTMPIYSSRIQ